MVDEDQEDSLSIEEQSPSKKRKEKPVFKIYQRDIAKMFKKVLLESKEFQ